MGSSRRGWWTVLVEGRGVQVVASSMEEATALVPGGECAVPGRVEIVAPSWTDPVPQIPQSTLEEESFEDSGVHRRRAWWEEDMSADDLEEG